MTKREEDRIVAEVSNSFAVFGGGRGGNGFNPLCEMLKKRAPMFAMGVDVRQVVQFVAGALTKRRKKPQRNRGSHAVRSR